MKVKIVVEGVEKSVAEDVIRDYLEGEEMFMDGEVKSSEDGLTHEWSLKD